MKNKVKYSRLERNECIDGLASELICGTDDSSLGNTLVKDESRFNLSGRETVTGDVDDI